MAGVNIFISLESLYILMEGEGIYLKKVDRRMYRKLKALAAQNGLPVYKVLNEAIAAYLRSSHGVDADEEAILSRKEVDNLAFKLLESDGSSRGRWAGITDGKVLGTKEGVEEVIAAMRERYSKAPFSHGIIAQVGQAREEREWLAGSLQEG